MNLDELVRMSNRYGQNPDYVLAGGGNTSVKDLESIYVKCSGTQLATITADGFVRMDKNALSALMKKSYPSGDKEREAEFLSDVMRCITDENPNKRPSVEALLHSLFPQRYVLHVHPSLINGLTCAQGAEDLCERLFKEKVIWIPIVRPGYTLGKMCFEAMSEYEKKYDKKAQILILQNHGIFVAGENVEEIDDLFVMVEDVLRAEIKHMPDLSPLSESEAALADETASELSEELKIPVDALKIKEALNFSKDKNSAQPIMKPFTPDHIVYMGPYPLYLQKVGDANTAYREFAKKNGFAPKIILIEGKGSFIADESEPARAKAKLLLTDAMKVAVYSESFGGALPMTEDLTEFILHWEAESYRKSQG